VVFSGHFQNQNVLIKISSTLEKWRPEEIDLSSEK